jgi:isoquinoline 1-oxidoreductase beta subunit
MGVAIADLGGGAICDYNKAVCAHVVHAAVGNGKWRIKKIYSIVYCGTIINPLGVRAQIEGSINWSLTPLIYGGVTVKNGRVVERNFNNHKVLRHKGAPEVEIHLIESKDKPIGMGEPAVPPLAPAVLNALYAASGKRFRDIHVKELEYEFA